MNDLMKLVIFAVCVSLALLQDTDLAKAQNVNSTITVKPISVLKSLARSETNETTLSTPTSSHDTKVVNSTSSPKDHVNHTSGDTHPTSGGTYPTGSGMATDGMLQRSLYVAIGISTLVALYLIVRTIKTRRRRKAKKYGVIHGAASAELQPLDRDVDEEEEDLTLFDVKDAKRPLK